MAETAVDAPEGVPLDLIPLLSIYGRDRRLSLRVERLPERARLSRGRNNGDRSWSLVRDDLDGLRYFPPEGSKLTHTLAVRVINLDTNDGATLAVLDFPISPSRQRLGSESAVVSDLELLRMREEVAQLKSALNEGQRELIDTRAALELARSEEARSKSELVTARASWQGELEKEAAAAREKTASELDVIRAAWQAEQRAAFDTARARWQRDAELALERAKEAWKSEEAARQSQAELLWQEQSSLCLAEAIRRAENVEAALARAEADAARMSAEGIELRRVRGELAEANALLNSRSRELAETRHTLESARAEAFKGKEELAAARAAWQVELERRLADERSEVATKLTTLQAGEAAVISEQIVQARLNEARAQWQQQLEISISKAREVWKAEETARLARAEEQWREKSARALTESAARLERTETALARAQAAALHETADGIELRRVREELAVAKTALSDREARLSQAKLEMQRARERWKADSEIAIKKAQEAWKAEEAYRISVIRGDWQRDLRIGQHEVEDAEEQGASRSSLRLVRDGLMAAGFAIVVVFLYPMLAPLVEPWLPYGILPSPQDNTGSNAPSAVSIPSTHPTATPAAVLHTMTVGVRAANIRAEPSDSARIVATVKKGAIVTALDRSGTWDHVRIGGGTDALDGWIFGAFLTDASQSPAGN